MRHLLPLALLLGGCASHHAQPPVSGPATTEPEVFAAVESRVPYQPAPTVAPTTTHTHPTTTAPAVVAAAATPAVRSGSVPAAIARYFGTGTLGHQATNVARCESELNPNAVSSTNDHGTFQLHAGSPGFPGGWVETFEQVTGVPFFDGVYDPDLNAQFARWLYDRSGWQPWACRSAA